LRLPDSLKELLDWVLEEAGIERNIGHGHVRVGRQTQTLDLGDLAEELGHDVLIGIEGEVADEEGVALRADGVTMSLGTVGSAVTRGSIVSRARLGRIQSHATTLKLEALHGIEGGLAVLGAVEVDVAEATGALHILVGDYAGAVKASTVLEGLVERVIVNGPAKVTNEQGDGTLLGVISLGLLGSGGGLIVSLALLGGLGLLLLGLLGVRVRVGAVGIVGAVVLGLDTI
jgi:hypothetical protein